jgi:hypothetical protein
MFIVLFWGQGTSLHPLKVLVVLWRNNLSMYVAYLLELVDRGVAHGSNGNWVVAQTGLAVYVYACGKFCLIKIISWFSNE